MSAQGLQVVMDRAGAAELAAHLHECSEDFVPPLAGRVEIATYAAKIAARARRFEAWDASGLVGLVAVYDDAGADAFITNVSVSPRARGQGVAARLLRACLQHVGAAGPRRVRLEVNEGNGPAVRLYEAMGFTVTSRTGGQLGMEHATGREQQ